MWNIHRASAIMSHFGSLATLFLHHLLKWWLQKIYKQPSTFKVFKFTLKFFWALIPDVKTRNVTNIRLIAQK